jgi:peptidoglycan hydrolase CwlO-like protein
MKKRFLIATAIATLLLSSCGEKNSDSTNPEKTTTPSEEVSNNTVEIEETTEKLSSDIDELKTTTEDTKDELDELLNDL